MKILIALICLTLSLEQPKNKKYEPRWAFNVGSITCINAKEEHHYVNGLCDTTSCTFYDESYYVFIVCENEDIRCVAFVDADDDGNVDQMAECTEEEIVF